MIKHLHKLTQLSSQFSPKIDLLILNSRRFNILLHAYKLGLMTSLPLKKFKIIFTLKLNEIVRANLYAYKRTLNRRSFLNKGL